MKYEVKLKVTRHVTFEIDDEHNDPYRAYRSAVESYNDGNLPDDEDFSDLELETIKDDAHDVDVYFHLDLNGPRDECGLLPWKAFARDESGKRIGEGQLEDVLHLAFADDEDAES